MAPFGLPCGPTDNVSASYNTVVSGGGGSLEQGLTVVLKLSVCQSETDKTMQDVNNVVLSD